MSSSISTAEWDGLWKGWTRRWRGDDDESGWDEADGREAPDDDDGLSNTAEDEEETGCATLSGRQAADGCCSLSLEARALMSIGSITRSWLETSEEDHQLLHMSTSHVPLATAKRNAVLCCVG